MQSRARRIVRIVLLGVAISLAQSWGSVAWNKLGMERHLLYGFDSAFTEPHLVNPRSVIVRDGPRQGDGSSLQYTLNTYDHGVQTLSMYNVCMKDFPMPSVEGDPPAWSVAKKLTPGGQRSVTAHSWYELVAGWPMPSFYGRCAGVFDHHALRFRYHWAVPWSRPDAIDQAILPFRPLPGLLINTLFYGAIAELLIYVVYGRFRRTRSAYRTKRARCISCGYTLNSLPTCPECGTRRPDA